MKKKPRKTETIAFRVEAELKKKLLKKNIDTASVCREALWSVIGK